MLVVVVAVVSVSVVAVVVVVVVEVFVDVAVVAVVSMGMHELHKTGQTDLMRSLITKISDSQRYPKPASQRDGGSTLPLQFADVVVTVLVTVAGIDVTIDGQASQRPGQSVRTLWISLAVCCGNMPARRNRHSAELPSVDSPFARRIV